MRISRNVRVQPGVDLGPKEGGGFRAQSSDIMQTGLAGHLDTRQQQLASQLGLFQCSFPVLRIRDVYPGSEFSPSRILDPGAASKNLSFLTHKMVCKLSEMWSGLSIPDPDPVSWFFTNPGSRIQGWKRHRIPDSGSGSATLLFSNSLRKI